MISKYKDIINLRHHVSKKHIPMSLESRAAQFAPFAALTGHAEAIKEAGRITYDKIEIAEDFKMIINSKLQMIQEKVLSFPEISVTYFLKDKKKSGGQYFTFNGHVRKIDFYNRVIVFIDDVEICIDDIIDISGDIFDNI